jgi:imidazolonepropionase-like amidohydrolase
MASGIEGAELQVLPGCGHWATVERPKQVNYAMSLFAARNRTNTAIFEGTEKTLKTGEVLVEGNRITSVGAPGELPRAGREVVDLGGATLMPGLVNTHSHLTYNNGTTVAELTAMPVEEHVLWTMHNARLALDMGFTAAIGAASAKPRLDIVIRNEINSGKVSRPAAPGRVP